MRLNKNIQNLLVILGTIIIGGGAFLYGALTAPQGDSQPMQSSTPTPSIAPVKKTFEQERETILAALATKYPDLTKDYTISKGKFYKENTLYGTTLTYKGSDTMNRDTLRLLMQKKDGIWTLRTNPPEPLLSKQSYSDIPVEVLRDINKAVSLPGVDTPTTQ